MGRLTKRIISVVLAVIMACSCVSVISVSAADSEKATTGQFQCDWFDESIIYPYTYSDEWFSESSFEYNHDLATFSLCLAMASFESFDETKPDGNISDLMQECGYEITSYGYDTEGYDTIGVEFGKKDITVSGKTYSVILAAIRSGNYGMEWGGNLRVGKGINHKGFDLAKELVFQYFNDYISKADLKENVKLLVAGYSRGAAVSNLVAAGLDDNSYVDSLVGAEDNIAKAKISHSDTYTYTFEAPQCTRDEKASSKVYSNIFNSVNTSDYVTKFVMDDWGFTHYGIDKELPSADNCSNYSYYYDKVCKEFDTMMADSGKKSKDYFYDADSSKSVNATFDYIFSGLSSEVMISQDVFADEYEDGVAVLAGQYLGLKLGGKDIAATMGATILATLISIIPKNMEKIKSDGFRAYLAKKISEYDVGADLSDKQIENLLNLLDSLLEYLNKNTNNVLSLVSQYKTVLYIHQPYIALSWMRALSADDIDAINSKDNSELSISYSSLDLKHNTNGRIEAKYDNTKGYVKWSSDNDAIAKVDDNGNVKGGTRGTTIVTATLYNNSDEPVAKASTTVTVHMNFVQIVYYSIKGLIVN